MEEVRETRFRCKLTDFDNFVCVLALSVGVGMCVRKREGEGGGLIANRKSGRKKKGQK